MYIPSHAYLYMYMYMYAYRRRKFAVKAYTTTQILEHFWAPSFLILISAMSYLWTGLFDIDFQAGAWPGFSDSIPASMHESL